MQEIMKRCSICNLPKGGGAFFLGSSVCVRCADSKLGPQSTNVVPFATHSIPVVQEGEMSKISEMYSRLSDKPTSKESAPMSEKQARIKRGKQLQQKRESLGWTRVQATENLVVGPNAVHNSETKGCSQDIFEKMMAAYKRYEDKQSKPTEARGVRNGPVETFTAINKPSKIHMSDDDRDHIKSLLKQLGWTPKKAAEELGWAGSSIANYIGHGGPYAKYKEIVDFLGQALTDKGRRIEALPGKLTKEVVQVQPKQLQIPSADIQKTAEVVQLRDTTPKTQLPVPVARTSEGAAYRDFALEILTSVQTLLTKLPVEGR